jgi:hypothetical protein
MAELRLMVKQLFELKAGSVSLSFPYELAQFFA